MHASMQAAAAREHALHEAQAASLQGDVVQLRNQLDTAQQELCAEHSNLQHSLCARTQLEELMQQAASLEQLILGHTGAAPCAATLSDARIAALAWLEQCITALRASVASFSADGSSEQLCTVRQQGLTASASLATAAPDGSSEPATAFSPAHAQQCESTALHPAALASLRCSLEWHCATPAAARRRNVATSGHAACCTPPSLLQTPVGGDLSFAQLPQESPLSAPYSPGVADAAAQAEVADAAGPTSLPATVPAPASSSRHADAEPDLATSQRDARSADSAAAGIQSHAPASQRHDTPGLQATEQVRCKDASE